MDFEIIEPVKDVFVATAIKKSKKKKKQDSSEYITFDDGSCGCCCSGNPDANSNKRCSACEDCTHVGECEEVYFYGRCVCGKSK